MKPYLDQDGITLYHGDCAEVLPALVDTRFDLVIADPPYNLGKNYGPSSSDSRDWPEYWRWFREVFDLVYERMDDGYLYCSHSDRAIWGAKPVLEEVGFQYHQTIIWYGKNGWCGARNTHSWTFRHEPILFMRKGEPEHMRAGVKGLWYASVIEATRPQSNFREGRFHVCQKPVDLYERILLRTPSAILLDPFCGSGSALVAAKKLGLRAIGIEIEESHCETTAQRLAQLPLPM